MFAPQAGIENDGMDVCPLYLNVCCLDWPASGRIIDFNVFFLFYLVKLRLNK